MYNLALSYNKIIVCTLLIIVAIAVTACQDNDIEPLSPIPSIELVSVSPNVIQEFAEKVFITIRYEDGNGDIGYDNPDLNAVFVKDSRLAEADGYHVPPITPPNTNLAVTGQLTIELKNNFILGNSDEEVITYEIQLQDRAGNLSNTVETETITIIR